MKDLNKINVLEELLTAQYTKDAQYSWSVLGDAISRNANMLHKKRIVESSVGSGFEDWWQSCCSLLHSRQVKITNVHFDTGLGQDQSGEYIEITNDGPLIVDLKGWCINAGNNGQTMHFSTQTLLMPSDSLRIYTNKEGELGFDSEQGIWNNKGDKGYLYDNHGVIVSSWLYGKFAHEHVAISNIFYDGKVKHTEADEYAEISNLSEHNIDLTNWCLNAGPNQTFIFPENSILKPYSKIRVYTNQENENEGGYSFNSKTALWNNKGDKGILSDYKNCQVSIYSYGDK